MTTITCPVNDTVGICSTLDSSGAGMGVFFQYMLQWLPAFLIIVAVVGGIVLLFTAVAKRISGSIGHR